MLDNLYDDEKQVEKERYDREMRQLLNLRSVLGSRPGRRFIWDEIADCGVFRTTFVQDPYASAFNEGQRNRGVRLLALITEHYPDTYLLMVKEAKEDQDYERSRDNDSSTGNNNG